MHYDSISKHKQPDQCEFMMDSSLVGKCHLTVWQDSVLIRNLILSAIVLLGMHDLPLASAADSSNVSNGIHEEWATAEPLYLSVGQAHVLLTAPLRRIAVGNGRVIQVNSLNSRELLIMPDATGQSTLHLWEKDGRQKRFRVLVAESSTEQLAEEVRSTLRNSPRVNVRVVGDRVVVEGGSPSEEDAFRIGDLAKKNPRVINLVSRTGFERMVHMEVRMIEMARNSLNSIGVQWQSGGGTPYAVEGPSFGVVGDFARGQAFRDPSSGVNLAGISIRDAINPVAWAASMASSVTSMINLMVSRGEAVVLAEPRLSSRSGGTARFVAGGELPIPVISPNGSSNVQFKEYGVRFEVSPVVNEDGIISASLQTEISSINPEVKIQNVPGLRKQSAQTQVNLRDGETLVIAGMIGQEMSSTVDRVPGAGNIPVLGSLFRSKRFQNRHTELIVLITPRLDGSSALNGVDRANAANQALDSAKERIDIIE